MGTLGICFREREEERESGKKEHSIQWYMTVIVFWL